MYLLKRVDVSEPEVYETPVLVSDSKSEIYKFLLTLPFIISASDEKIEINHDYFIKNDTFKLEINGHIDSIMMFSDSEFVIESIPTL